MRCRRNTTRFYSTEARFHPRAQSLQVPVSQSLDGYYKTTNKIAASKQKKWQRFDDDMSKELQAMSKGGTDKKLYTLTTIITSFTSETFGCVVVRQKNAPYSKNGRKIQIKNVHKELIDLKKQHKRVSSEYK